MAAIESPVHPPEGPGNKLQAIRPASTADIYDVYQLNREAFAESWSVMALGLWQERGDDLDVCYDSEGRLAAYYLGQDVLDEVHIMQLAVAPDYRRCGLARHLMQYKINQKRAAGKASMLLEVRAYNRAAQRLYTGLGFEIVGQRNGYYSPTQEGLLPEDALLMSFVF
ncbi:MAG: ribosomal protein S18-alanine N-acetyltransferase [Mariprofundaceae bacterium]|nr:ribosomal protein S18-alanine N-acetyltransferase [Mariprofundaceae bacterium]